ncbi:MAG: hypothetical protein JXL97_18645 [Bacteroidales bacterium]|nr:hypothetical protein [Bacteroidales bacterium]
MKKLLKISSLVLFLGLMFSSNLNAQNMKFYERKWQVVDSLVSKALPQSAIKEIDEIYQKASKDDNQDQLLKCYVYYLKTKDYYQEDAFETILYQMEDDISKAPFPNDAMLHTMLADMYWWYYQSKSWEINQRTEIANFKPADIKTWTTENFVDAVIKHHNASLERADELKKIPADYYSEMITKGTKPKYLRPTLYDFIVARVVQFYSNSEVSITRPADYFEIDDDFYFGSAKDFANKKIESDDTLSLHFNGIKILQDWLKFRLSKTNEPEALIDADIVRLDYVYGFTVNPQKEDLYLKAFQNLESKYPGNKHIKYVKLKIANYYYNLASKYNPEDAMTKKYKDYYKIAYEKFSELCKGVKEYDEVSGVAQQQIYYIEGKSLNFYTEEVLIPNETFSLKVDYRNITKVYVEVRAVTYSAYTRMYDKSTYSELIDKIRSRKKLISSFEFDLTGSDDFQRHTTELLLDGLPTGEYMILMSTDKDFKHTESYVSSSYTQVSEMSMVYQMLSDGSYDCFVMNRKTGKPETGVTIKAFYDKYNYQFNKYIEKHYGTYTSDKDGYFEIPATSDDWINLRFILSKKSDTLQILNGFYIDKRVPYESKKPVVQFFTDRKIYRPGQIIYFKGIILNEYSKNRKIIPNKQVDVIFYDVNYQEIAKQTLTSNEYGTFNGSFTIPKGLLNGTMTITTSYGSTSIQVEEYKRPTFETEILPITEQFLVNDLITVKGKAENYSGVKLTDAMVQFTVQRQNIWYGWWWWSFRTDVVMIERGVVKTDENGEYEIKFTAKPDLEMPVGQNTAFNYIISVDVTDVNGETQSTSQSINVGYTALKLSTNISDKLNKDKMKGEEFVISAKNLNYEDVQASGKMQIYSLVTPDKPIKNRYWAKPDQPIYSAEDWKKEFPGNEFEKESDYRNWKENKMVWDKTFDTKTSKKIKMDDFASFAPGVYKMVMTSKDAFGNDVKNEQFFTVYNTKSKELPYKTDSWFAIDNNYCQPGETASFLVGSANETTVIYEVIRSDKVIKREYLKIKDGQKLIEIPITEDMRGGFSVALICIAENRIHSYTASVIVPFSNKELEFEFATFRDKLQPGQEEEWQIIIKDKSSGDKMMAELLTTMYDASLDALMSNYWSFSPFASTYGSLYWGNKTFGTKNSSGESYFGYKYTTYSSLYYNSLNWFGFSYYNYYYDDFGGNYRYKSMAKNGEYLEDDMDGEVDFMVMDEEKSIDKKDAPAMPVSQSNITETTAIDGRNEVMGEALGGKEKDDVQIRKNFNETAFFYPDLKTNEKGEVVISFTIPESLTKWRFMGLAHTKDLKYAQFDKYVVTQKELMVMPNAPRFYRQGDTMFFAAKIANLSEEDLNGTVTLEFVDELSGKEVNILAKGVTKEISFDVKKGMNTPVSWEIIIPDDVKMLTYKIIAKAGSFSDGEQKPLPVLTNRILVTESLPLPIRANQTKTFEFTKLIESAKSTTIKTDKLTVEFTSNPAWYAVQALPYLIEYPYECSEQTFARYYANTLASFIANSSPKIQAVFETWKNYEPDALLSNLEKNQELKQVLLEETPWVLESQDEGQRKRNIALLFDLNRMSYEMSNAYQKLKKDQTVNGGWPWFKGMPESWYITQYIAEGIGHLMHLNVIGEKDKDVIKMGENAVGYCDREMKEDYDWIKTHYTKVEMEQYRVSSIIVHYFYMRSFYSINLDKKYEEAYNYFYGQMKKYWTEYTLYSQGLMTMAFYRADDLQIANDLVKSFKERALYHEELGMYWKENASGYYWYQSPVQTQALMIEVFEEVAKDRKDVDELKVWLLKNKQTNDWKTTTATAEAIYALLLTGGVDLLANSEIVPVQLGKMLIDPENDPDISTEAGTGYYKVTFSGNEVKPEWGHVRVENKNNGVAWGAVYWQYFEDIDKITPHETPLKLQKDLYKEVMTDRGATLELIKGGENLAIGDKIIVRIELRVDRDMEFVHMKDMRASGFEPINVISRYKWQDGLGYYETTKDASTNFFFDFLPKGTYVFEYPLRVTTAGSFSNGITTIQCMYAPEFMSHSKGQRVKIQP